MFPRLLCTYQSSVVSETMLSVVDQSRSLQSREATALSLLRALEQVHGKDAAVPKVCHVDHCGNLMPLQHVLNTIPICNISLMNADEFSERIPRHVFTNMETAQCSSII